MSDRSLLPQQQSNDGLCLLQRMVRPRPTACLERRAPLAPLLLPGLQGCLAQQQGPVPRRPVPLALPRRSMASPQHSTAQTVLCKSLPLSHGRLQGQVLPMLRALPAPLLASLHRRLQPTEPRLPCGQE